MVKIIFNKNKNNSEALDANIKIGECDFIEEKEYWNIVHTEVSDVYTGQGIAKKLVEIIIKNTKNYNKKIIADCSYAKKIIKQHKSSIKEKRYLMYNKNFIITEENVKEYCEKIGEWIRKTVESANANGVVLGMSSGVDCSTVARLCQNAGVNTHLIIMPYGDDMTKTQNYSDAMELINKFKFDYHVFDIKPAVDSLQIPNDSEIIKNANEINIELSKANIRPRVRMTYLYQYAQVNNLLVIGTGNLSECTVGYFTKWGDGACDLNPMRMITKKEVYILAKYLQVPECIINKKPSAGLWEGQTDEEELGIKYEQIDDFILKGTSGDNKIDEEILSKNKKSMHKLNGIQIFNK